MSRNVPDYEDANLILRLYEERREPKLREAREWFLRDLKLGTFADFGKRCPPGSDEHRMFRMVSSYWEMVAAIVNSKIIDANLYFQTTGEHLVVWERIRPIVGDLRRSLENPIAFRSLERLAEDHYAWYDQQSPGLAESRMEFFRGLGK